MPLFPGQIIDQNYSFRLGGSTSNYGGFLQAGILPTIESYGRDWGTYCIRTAYHDFQNWVIHVLLKSLEFSIRWYYCIKKVFI